MRCAPSVGDGGTVTRGWRGWPLPISAAHVPEGATCAGRPRPARPSRCLPRPDWPASSSSARRSSSYEGRRSLAAPDGLRVADVTDLTYRVGLPTPAAGGHATVVRGRPPQYWRAVSQLRRPALRRRTHDQRPRVEFLLG